MLNKPLHKRKSPDKLASKLLDIRVRLRESQNGMLRKLGLEHEFERGYVSKWERGVMEPPLYVLCAYADVINVYLDVLARDTLELPSEIPSRVKSFGLKKVV